MINYKELAGLLKVNLVVSEEEKAIISQLVNISAEDNEHYLRLMRNTTVEAYADLKQEARDFRNWEMYDMYQNAMSKVTSVIDTYLLGGHAQC